MKRMFRFLAPALAVLLCACGSYSPLKQYDKQTFSGLDIGEIRINKQIEIGSWFDGAVSAAQGSNVESMRTSIVEKDLVTESPDQDLPRIRAALQQSGLDLASSIRETFAAELKNRKALQAKDGAAASHRLNLSVDAFMLGYKPLSGYGPDFGLQAELFDGRGRSGWKNYRYITHFSGQTTHYSISEFSKNPAALRKAYETAITLVIRDLLTDLETEVNDRSTDYIDNITGDRVRIERISAPPAAAIAPAPAQAAPVAQPAGKAPPATADKTAQTQPESKPSVNATKKMVYNPVTDQMEEQTNCNGFCLPNGFKFDGKNIAE
jgi:hypothetical protein